MSWELNLSNLWFQVWKIWGQNPLPEKPDHVRLHVKNVWKAQFICPSSLRLRPQPGWRRAIAGSHLFIWRYPICNQCFWRGVVAGQAIRPRRQWSFSRHYSKQSKMGKEASIKGSKCLIWKAEQSKIKFKETTAFLERWVLFDHNASVLLKSVPCSIFLLKSFFDIVIS